jgi:hypothetical protein
MWDNRFVFSQMMNSMNQNKLIPFRCTIHRVIPGKYASGTRRGIRTTVFGEKRKNDSAGLVWCSLYLTKNSILRSDQ